MSSLESTTHRARGALPSTDICARPWSVHRCLPSRWGRRHFGEKNIARVQAWRCEGTAVPGVREAWRVVQPPPANPACGSWVPQFLQPSHPPAKTALPKAGTVSAASAPYVVQPGTEPHTNPRSSGQATVARGPCVTTTPISLPSAKPDHHPRFPHFPTVHQGCCQVPRSLCWGSSLLFSQPPHLRSSLGHPFVPVGITLPHWASHYMSSDTNDCPASPPRLASFAHQHGLPFCYQSLLDQSVSWLCPLILALVFLALFAGGPCDHHSRSFFPLAPTSHTMHSGKLIYSRSHPSSSGEPQMPSTVWPGRGEYTFLLWFISPNENLAHNICVSRWIFSSSEFNHFHSEQFLVQLDRDMLCTE